MVKFFNNKIRVLYVVENRSFGGGERGFGQLSTNISIDRFQPFVAAHPGGKLEDIVRQAGVPFFPLDMSRRANLRTISHLSTLVSENGIDIVHSMGARADFFARMACRKQPSTAVVCTAAMLVEGFDVGLFRKTAYKIADRFSGKYVTQYIAVSKALKHRLVEERGIPADKVSVIYNGVELDRYDPNLYDSEGVRRSLDIKDDYPIIGTIGRLVYQKGFSHFLKAAELVYAKKKQVRFVIIGHGPEETNLKHLAESLGISHVCMFPGIRFDVARLLSTFHVFVLPSVLEGLPRTIIEAMAMKRPIVATSIDGVREQLRDNITGLLVSPADPKALAEAILSILNDHKRAERLGREARKDAQRMFDLKNTLNKIETLYEKALNSITRK
jgi:glycosyltransferase involved in cell wall biosynthesis